MPCVYRYTDTLTAEGVHALTQSILKRTIFFSNRRIYT